MTGVFARAMDEKQRVALPKELRSALTQAGGDSFYAAPGTDGSLSLYGEPEFLRLSRKLARSSSGRSDARAYGRLFYAQARRIQLDGQGRLRVPPELAEWAGLKSSAVLVGVGDHVEIWNEERWKTYLAEHQGRFDELAEAALDQTARPR
ncbi:MAG: division/cell wall cluster transcriptional repressor MraZ [Planctomycetia bacterium]|nr:division/cell wall cluster transcriptional repressor MraZ [Planctomycetia bacterium]